MNKGFITIFHTAVFLFLSNAASICASDNNIEFLKSRQTAASEGYICINETSRHIICTDIDETGFASAYMPHIFTLNEASDIKDYNWSFVLYDSLGQEHIISDSTEPQFEIQPLQNVDIYETDSNGNIIGSIICTYSLDGKSERSATTVYLERQPVILSIENKTIHPANDYEGYYLTFDVYYLGAETVYIDLEEEYSSSLRSQIIHSPYKASVRTGDINPYNHAWIHIKVHNKYGEAAETIESDPENHSETFDYEISNITYDYTATLKDGRYDISGDFSFDVKVSNIPEFIIANTNPNGHIKDFYSVKRLFEANSDGVTEKHYMRPDTRPETFFKLLIRKKDGTFFSSPAICTTDYLKPEDKGLILSNIPSKTISKGFTVYVENSILRLSSGPAMQHIALIDINGSVIKHIDPSDSHQCEISLADISGGFYIIRVTDAGGRSYSKVCLLGK